MFQQHQHHQFQYLLHLPNDIIHLISTYWTTEEFVFTQQANQFLQGLLDLKQYHRPQWLDITRIEQLNFYTYQYKNTQILSGLQTLHIYRFQDWLPFVGFEYPAAKTLLLPLQLPTFYATTGKPEIVQDLTIIHDRTVYIDSLTMCLSRSLCKFSNLKRVAFFTRIEIVKQPELLNPNNTFDCVFYKGFGWWDIYPTIEELIVPECNQLVNWEGRTQDNLSYMLPNLLKIQDSKFIWIRDKPGTQFRNSSRTHKRKSLQQPHEERIVKAKVELVY
jgi:hypothetical protein